MASIAVRLTWRGPDTIRQIDAAVDRSATRIGREWQGQAQQLCPVRTGKLRGGINYEVHQIGTGVVLVLYDDVEYTLHVVFGTGRMPARDFMRPPVDAVLPNLGGYIRDELARAG